RSHASDEVGTKARLDSSPRGATRDLWRSLADDQQEPRRAEFRPRSGRHAGGLGGGLQLVQCKLGQWALLDLAGDGHRERVDEAPVARNLVMRDLAPAESAEFLR